jgi:Zn-finger nucleic acid-binding protein
MNSGFPIECPSCGAEVAETEFDGVFIRRCRECAGAWLHEEEIRLLLQTTELSLSEEERAAVHRRWLERAARLPGAERACPKCAVPMERFQFLVSSGVHLSFCPNNHGIWLEPGELEEILRVMAELEARDPVAAAHVAARRLRPPAGFPRSSERIRLDLSEFA